MGTLHGVRSTGWVSTVVPQKTTSTKEVEDQQRNSGLGFCLIFRKCILLEWVKQSHAMGVAPGFLFLSSSWVKSHFIEAFSLINSKAIS